MRTRLRIYVAASVLCLASYVTNLQPDPHARQLLGAILLVASAGMLEWVMRLVERDAIRRCASFIRGQDGSDAPARQADPQ